MDHDRPDSDKRYEPIETDSSRRRRIGDEIIRHLGGESVMQGVNARRFERLARGVIFDIPGKAINRIAIVQADDGTFSIIGYLAINMNVQKKAVKANIQADDLHAAFIGMVE